MRTRPPGPTGEPLLGNARRYARDPFSFMTAVGDAYGDVARLDLGPRETYMLTNPRDIERVLVSDAAAYVKPDLDSAVGDLLGRGLLLSEGGTWARQRELATPAFRGDRVSALGDLMAGHAADAVAEWDAGDEVDVQEAFARLTVRIIVHAMFGTGIDDGRIRTVQESLEPLGRRFEPSPLRTVVPDWAPTRENRAFADAVGTLEGIIDDLVAERRGTEQDAADPAGEVPGQPKPMDLLSILLRARERGEQTDRQVRDELVTMLLAGHDTTALALTYTVYLLSESPEARERIHAEVDAIDGRPTVADARGLTYTDRVLTEAMRLYPPVYTMFREPKLDVRLGGYRVPEGAVVMLPQWVVHRSDRWYREPGAFDPERWTPDRRAGRPNFAYFPFGAGPRHCIGRQFSLLEATLILATLYREFDPEYVGPELSLRGSLTMHPDHPMPVHLRAH